MIALLETLHTDAEALLAAQDDPLLGLENMLITPHVAALTDTTYRTMCMRTAYNVPAVLDGKAPEAVSIFVLSR